MGEAGIAPDLDAMEGDPIATSPDVAAEEPLAAPPAETATVLSASPTASKSTGLEVGATLRRSIKTAMRRILELNRMTEEGVLNAGNALQGIVSEATEHVAEARQTLETVAGGESGESVAELVQVQNRLLQQFVDEVRGQLESQSEIASAAVDASRNIARLGSRIGSVAFQSRLLSLNATIEAGRMGEAGVSFGVIAAEMTNLSQQVGETSKMVNALVAELSESLPSIAESARDIRQTSETFLTKIGAQIGAVETTTDRLSASVEQTLRSGDERLERVIRQSQDALSNLQFQDPVAQGLLAVAKDFTHGARRVRSMVEGAELDSEQADAPGVDDTEQEIKHVAVLDGSEDAPEAGEVMLL